MTNEQPDATPEIDAMKAVYTALKSLDSAAQKRVIRYSAEMLGIDIGGQNITRPPGEQQDKDTDDLAPTVQASDSESSHDADGINAVALKWIKRSNFEPKALESLFSLGIEEIDLVAKSIPGTSKKERMKSVLLLKGIAAYLGTGVARVSYEQLKEASLHYDAYDSTNFAAYLKSFSAEVAGTKETGYTLTPRGLTSATDLLKEMLSKK